MKAWMNRIPLVIGMALLWSAIGACRVHAEDSQAKRSKQALSVRSIEEVAHISTLIKALRSYASIYGGNYPANIEALAQKNILSADELKKLTNSPLAVGMQGSGADGYLYFFAGKRSDTPGASVLIVGKYSLSTSDQRRAVGLQDGSVSWWKRPQVESFLKNPGKQ